MKRHGLTVLQILITLGFLWWIFSNVELRENMKQTLERGIHPAWALLGIALAGVGIMANVLRWYVILRILDVPATLWRTTKLFFVGLFFNLFLFGVAGGDAVKILYLIKDHPDRKSGVFLSVLIDHMSGLLAFVFAALVFTVGRYQWFIQTPLTSGMVWLVLGYVVFAVFGVILAFSVSPLRLAERAPFQLPGHDKFVEMTRACDVFRHQWKGSLLAMGISFVVVFTYFSSFYCAGHALNVPVSLFDIFSVMPMVDVITALPTSVSGLGVREKVFEKLLDVLCGIPANEAILISLLGFSFSAFWSIVGALVFPFYKPLTGHSLGLKTTIKEASHVKQTDPVAE